MAPWMDAGVDHLALNMSFFSNLELPSPPGSSMMRMKSVLPAAARRKSGLRCRRQRRRCGKKQR